jgi:hypothetical protein
VPYAAFLPPDDTTVLLTLPSSHLLSSMPFTFGDLDHERRPKSHKIRALFVIQNSLSVGSSCRPTFRTPYFQTGGQERPKCRLVGEDTDMVEHKIRTCYYIVIVIFVLSTPELCDVATAERSLDQSPRLDAT